MINNLLELLKEVRPLSAQATERLSSIFNIHNKPKGTQLLKEGEISEHLFFVVKGLARACYYEKEVQITSWMVAENEFIYSPASFILQKPSIETIELLENTTYLSISKKDLENTYQAYPETAYVSLKINQKYILLFEERAKLLRLSADERYARFEIQYPYLKGRLKMEHLATYLGLSRSSIQSIKNKDYFLNKITGEL